MSKFLLRLAAMLVMMGVLVGCTTNVETNESEGNNNPSNEVAEESVVITISKDDGAEVVTEKEISIQDGDILMDVMKEHFEIETDFDDAFITSIDGIAPEEGEQKGWLFFVNDEMPVVGANELELSPGDLVTFDFQAWE